MFAYITGDVTEQYGNVVVVENSGIGYKIITPNPFHFHLHSHTKIYTHQYVREDINDLFGFVSKEQRELFLSLISVKGIGPKGALAILAADSVEQIVAAIETGNSSYLRKFPGIGPKASQQIILDLKGKLDQAEAQIPGVMDTKEVLLSLGYKASEINKVLPKLDPTSRVDDMVKQALSLLLK